MAVYTHSYISKTVHSGVTKILIEVCTNLSNYSKTQLPKRMTRASNVQELSNVPTSRISSS